MSLRYSLGALLAVGLAMQWGCCFAPFAEPMLGPPWPCGNTYYGTQCGCRFWHWWFSHKPDCCDRCDCCGDFACSCNPYVESGPPYTRFGPLYSDGTGSNEPGAIGEMYPSPAGPTPAGPTPAEPPAEGVFDEAAPMNDVEPLPEPTTQMPPGAMPRMARRYGPVDSPRGSRTLGRPPRARLFSR